MAEKESHRFGGVDPEERISVDDLLEGQAQAQADPTLKATIESLEDDPTSVKVTPWSPAAGCSCHAAVNVPKASIDWVRPTGQTHHCCGKLLRLVEVHFKEGATIEVNELFLQLGTSAPGTSRPGWEPLATGPGLAHTHVPPPFTPDVPPDARMASTGFWWGLKFERWCWPQWQECTKVCDQAGNPMQVARCYCFCTNALYMCMGQPHNVRQC